MHLAQDRRETEAVHSPKPKVIRQRPRASIEQEIFEGHPGDRQRDGALDQTRRQLHDVEDGEGERHAVRDGERRHDREQRPESAAHQEEREQEEHVVVPGRDVLDAEHEEAPEGRAESSGRRPDRRPRRARG